MTLVALTLPAVAMADAELEQSTPADGATVASPFVGPIVMSFTAALAEGSTANLLDPDGEELGTTVVDGPGATMTITFDTALAAGTYEVRWVAVAADTHLSRDTFEFTVEPAPPTPEPTPEPTPTPEVSATAAPATSPPATSEPSAVPTPSPTIDDDAAGTADVLLPIVVALLVVGAGAVYLLTRRNRPSLPG
jgi:methionine-rich copper-binding protein CopC